MQGNENGLSKFVDVSRINTHYWKAGAGDQVVVLVYSRLWFLSTAGQSEWV